MAVPTGSPRLLIIALEAFGHVPMNHITHVRSVDALTSAHSGTVPTYHSERYSGHDAFHLACLPVRQSLLLLLNREHSMEGASRNSSGGKLMDQI